MEEVLGTCVDRGIKVVTNAGGLNPAGLADQVRTAGRPARTVVTWPTSRATTCSPASANSRRPGHPLAHLDTGRACSKPGAPWSRPTPTWAAWPIVEALGAGADVVVCPRVTDASLVVGPAAWHHGWSPTDWDALAGAVVAGHVIECGPQATGGNYAFFPRSTGWSTPGSPSPRWQPTARRSSPSTPAPAARCRWGPSPPSSSTRSVGTHYPNTDVVARFDTIEVTEVGHDRVAITGTWGLPAPGREGLPQSAGWLAQHDDLRAHRTRHRGKADLTVRSLAAALGGTGSSPSSTRRLVRSDKVDAPPTWRRPPSCGSR